MKRDEVFAKYLEELTPFRFDSTVTAAFDDMAERSIPDYSVNLKVLAQFAYQFYQPGTRIYDLGCSTGNQSLACASALQDHSPEIIAMDKSPEMIQRFSEKLQAFPDFRIDIQQGDVLDFDMEQASVVYMNYVLQFLHPDSRIEVLSHIYSALEPGGVLILSEKLDSSSAIFKRFQEDRYYNFKRENGYSNLEIAQKRDALEKVLRPDTPEKHLKRLNGCGFETVEMWWRNMNFASFIAIK